MKYERNCGTEIHCQNSAQTVAPKHDKFTIIVTALAVICVSIGIAIVWFGMKGNKSKESTSNENVVISEDGYNAFIIAEASLMEKERDFLSSDGYIEEERIPELLDVIERSILGFMDDELVEKYSRDDYCIYVEFTSGIKYLFIPPLKDKLSGQETITVCGLAPNQNTMEFYMTALQQLFVEMHPEYKGESGTFSIYSSIQNISKAIPNAHYKYIKNDEVTVESMKKLSDYEVIVLQGHGGYSEDTHSAIVTGEHPTAASVQDYGDDMNEGRLLITSNFLEGGSGIARYYVVTAKFFKKYLGEMNNSFVYLGACSSAKDPALAQVFIDKGAKAVLGFEDIVNMGYEMCVQRSLFHYLTDSTSEPMSLQQAMTKTIDVCRNTWESTNLVVFPENLDCSTYYPFLQPKTSIFKNGQYISITDSESYAEPESAVENSEHQNSNETEASEQNLDNAYTMAYIDFIESGGYLPDVYVAYDESIHPDGSLFILDSYDVDFDHAQTGWAIINITDRPELIIYADVGENAEQRLFFWIYRCWYPGSSDIVTPYYIGGGVGSGEKLYYTNNLATELQETSMLEDGIYYDGDYHMSGASMSYQCCAYNEFNGHYCFDYTIGDLNVGGASTDCSVAGIGHISVLPRDEFDLCIDSLKEITFNQFSDGNAASEWSELTDYYWYSNVQSWEVYEFCEDGSYQVYYTEMPFTPSENTQLTQADFVQIGASGSYDFDEKTLTLYPEYSEAYSMELYNKSQDSFPDDYAERYVGDYDGTIYFYQTYWEPMEITGALIEDHAYLVRLGKKAE